LRERLRDFEGIPYNPNRRRVDYRVPVEWESYSEGPERARKQTREKLVPSFDHQNVEPILDTSGDDFLS
jgi:hypothetical protein